jgi:hypothetical protein
MKPTYTHKTRERLIYANVGGVNVVTAAAAAHQKIARKTAAAFQRARSRFNYFYWPVETGLKGLLGARVPWLSANFIHCSRFYLQQNAFSANYHILLNKFRLQWELKIIKNLKAFIVTVHL